MRNKRRILHIIQSLGNGGCENFLLRVLPRLQDEFEHHIITLKTPGELAPKFEENNIPISTAQQKNIFDRHGYQNLLSEVRKFSPDIILTYLFHADIIGRLFLQKKISVPIIPFLRTTYNHPKYLIARLFEKATKHLVPHYLANSEAVKDFYVKNISVSSEKITVIPNGIDTDFFDSIVPDPNLRISLDFAPNDFIIISVANLHPNKGHRYLLEAFEQLHCHSSKNENMSPLSRGSSPSFVSKVQSERREKQNLKLLIVGNGKERKKLEQQIKNYQSKENILLLGHRTDVPELLKISDCFVLPTLFEGMSNAILEAMATGLPVITTDIPENRPLIINGESGTLIKVANTNEIVQSIYSLKENIEKRKILSQNARKFIHENFSIENTTKQWRRFLN